NDEFIAKKMKQIQERKERHMKHKAEKTVKEAAAAEKLRSVKSVASATPKARKLSTGDSVRMKGLTSVGIIDMCDGKMATVIFGGMRTKVPVDKLEFAEVKENKSTAAAIVVSRETRQTIDEHKMNFHQDLDVRGMRGDEALNAVSYFIDDAILVGMPRVRILHGKGNGILRQLIRQYLSTVPNITSYKDEHVQFGGAGITVVDF
ncbi:MAG: Smr/MutS family protein, partial [Prevotella sp.]